MVTNLDADLNETERAVQETAHRFAAEVMRPAGEALDKMTPDEAIADGSPLWDVFTQFRALGLNAASLSGEGEDELSTTEQARLQSLITEELGWGDSGLACSLGVSGMPWRFATMSGNPELIEKFSDDRIGCWAGTEPSHGSDFVDPEESISAPGQKRSRPDCIAKKDGNSFIISGQKAAWISNGTIAETAALFCGVDLGDGPKMGGVFLVSLDEDGVSKGAPLDKIGQRPLNQGEVFFDGLRVPADHMVFGPDVYAYVTNTILTQANTGMGNIFMGLARAAFEAALDYAKERVQGGVPIIQHQSVQSRIFAMYRKVEAARALNRRVTMFNASDAEPALEAAIATKVTSTQTAFEVASDALQIFGGAGISREYPIEKMFRDARISMIEDGCNEVLSMIGATKLAASA